MNNLALLSPFLPEVLLLQEIILFEVQRVRINYIVEENQHLLSHAKFCNVD